MIHFCTYFDSAYIHRGLALQTSLTNAGQPFTLWVLCFDDATAAALGRLRLPSVRVITLADFEHGDEVLQAAKGTRSRVEYYWTCTPSLPLYIFRQQPDIDRLVYLDADTFFFSSPAAILEELGTGSVLIVPHDYAREYDHEESGVYNVGIMAFRRDASGLSALKWWRSRCIEWCYWRHEEGKIGDQAYLNDWPERFTGVVVSRNPGINAAPWNIAKYGLAVDSGARLLVGGRPLVCFHFHGCRISSSTIALVAGFKVAIPTSRLSLVYRPYLAEVFRAERMLAEHGTDIRIPKSGMPWRYIVGRIVRGQPVRHVMWIGRRAAP